MKKILIVASILVLIIILDVKEYNSTRDDIRFRVVANSNSPRDILIKEKVVNELSKILFIDSTNINEVDDNIYSNLENIEQIIDDVFENNNYNKNYTISYGLNEIPRKVYHGKLYEKGLYKSLVIEIGEGKGNNYFCILYPSLCVIDVEENDGKKIKYNFRIKEFIKDHIL